jgi:hypothetical protein
MTNPMASRARNKFIRARPVAAVIAQNGMSMDVDRSHENFSRVRLNRESTPVELTLTSFH